MVDAVDGAGEDANIVDTLVDLVDEAMASQPLPAHADASSTPLAAPDTDAQSVGDSQDAIPIADLTIPRSPVPPKPTGSKAKGNARVFW